MTANYVQIGPGTDTNGNSQVVNAPGTVLMVTGNVGIQDVVFSGNVVVAPQVTVSNFPAVQAVAGIIDVTVTGSTGLMVAAPQGAPLWITGSVFVTDPGSGGGGSITGGVNVYTSGPQAVTGSVNVYTSGLQGISGSVSLVSQPSANVYTSGLQGISGTVSIGGPVNVYSPAIWGVSGTVGAVIQNWPATIGISGSITTLNSPPTNVYTSGPQAVSGTLNVYTSGLQGVSGTLAVIVQNQPLTTNVSGSVFLAPTIAAANAASFTGSMGQEPGVVKSSAGTLYKVWVTNRTSGSVYLQVFNSTAPPAGNAVPLASMMINSSGSGPTTPLPVQNPVFDGTPFGWNLSNGISLGISSNFAKYVPATNPGATGAGPFDTLAMFA